MDHSRPDTGRRILPALLGVAMALLIGAAPASATPTGKFGVHLLVDSEEYPAVSCIYVGVDQILSDIRVRPPIVFAYDAGPGTDTQPVGWRYKIQWSDLVARGTVWHPFFISSVVSAMATDHRNAAFTPRSHSFGPHVQDHTLYRVIYELSWFDPSGSTETGFSRLDPEFYRIVTPGNDPQVSPNSDCSSSD
jgi:hypothetical protein